MKGIGNQGVSGSGSVVMDVIKRERGGGRGKGIGREGEGGRRNDGERLGGGWRGGI